MYDATLTAARGAAAADAAHSLYNHQETSPYSPVGAASLADFGACGLISTDNMPPVQKDILGDTSRPQKLRTPLTFMAALLAVFSFAAPVMAASISCVGSTGDIVCDYDATGETPTFGVYTSGALLSNPIATGLTTEVDTITVTDGCVTEAGNTINFQLWVNNEGDLAATSGDVICSAGGGGGMLTYTPDDANGFLNDSVTGTLDFFWDNLKGVMMVVASIGIVCALFWWIYRTLKRRR